jgi:hypothetical protein
LPKPHLLEESLANEERFLEVAENSAIDVFVAATKENVVRRGVLGYFTEC